MQFFSTYRFYRRGGASPIGAYKRASELAGTTSLKRALQGLKRLLRNPLK